MIITRFIIPFWRIDNFTQKIYSPNYLLNGIRVMKKYLFPSLESQSCKDFIWILLLGDKSNITKVEHLLNINLPFKYYIIYNKSFKTFLKNKTKRVDILITTRIDYDDKIYYDAVNDIRKAVNINRPVLIYGYNSGLIYYEFNNKYYRFDINYANKGVMSIFVSLILVLNKVNDIYTVYDLGQHNSIRKTLLETYKSFGIKSLNYEPTIFDNGEVKFVWVRQNYSGQYSLSLGILKRLKQFNFNLSNFCGKF